MKIPWKLIVGIAGTAAAAAATYYAGPAAGEAVSNLLRALGLA
jgi:hypothetical protein